MSYFHIYSTKDNPCSFSEEDYLVCAEELMLTIDKSSSSIMLSIQNQTFDSCECPSVYKIPNCIGCKSFMELECFSIFRKNQCESLNEEEVKELFTDFQGTIIGYPYYNLSLYDINNENLCSCDFISIEKNHLGLVLSAIDLNNDCPKKQLTESCGIKINMKKIEGRILTNKGHFLDSKELYNYFVNDNYFIPPTHLSEDPSFIAAYLNMYRTNRIYDLIGSTLLYDAPYQPKIKYLDVSITHNSNVCHLYYSEIIEKKYFHHIHHSSFDGDDYGWDITTLVFWGDYKIKGGWNYGRIIKKLLTIATIDDDVSDNNDEPKIRFLFNKAMTSFELLQTTGLVLSSLIEETQEYE